MGPATTDRFVYLLAALGLIAAGLMNAATSSQTETQAPAFEVATIKPSDPTARSGCFIKGQSGPDEWAISIVAAGGSSPAPPKFKGTRCAMSYLSWSIAQRENRPVLDKTGLTGFWDFTLGFVPDGLGDGRKGPNGE
jgi:hypothetical protein